MTRKNYEEGEDNIKCKICGDEFKHLGSHIYHKHGMKAKDYKKKFGLDVNKPLISKEIRKKKQQHWDKNKEKYLKNLDSEKYQFKKGEVNRKYYSKETKERAKNQLKELNNDEKHHCPVCNMKFKKVRVHLKQKHGLRLTTI